MMTNMAAVPETRKTFYSRWLLPTLSGLWFHILLGACVLGLDLLVSPFLLFPILFVVPVTLASWYCRFRSGLALALALPIGRFCIALFIEHPSPPRFIVANALIRIAVLCLLAYLVARTARQTKELQRHVHHLEGLLHICMFCKRIRDEQKNWHRIEDYISAHSEADFSHGMCMECAQKYYPEVFAKKQNT